MSTVSGSLITRNYTNFRGVDFTDNEVSLTRSPDSINMWKDYSKLGKCIETRPEIELVETYDNTIFGLFFYKVGNTEMMLVHCGTTLYKVVNGVREVLYTGLNPKKSNSFVYNNIWYFKDGINYLQYDGEIIGEVTGYIPTTSISRSPNGGGTTYEDVNMLTGIRKNTFVGDGKSTDYYLDAQNIDANFQPIVLVNGEVVTDFTVDTSKGMISFATAPVEPLTVGQDNVSIQFRKTVNGYRERINKCTLLQVFDNRVFFSGNQDYPNTVWHCSLNDPSYCSDLDYYNEGLDLSPVKGMVAGNNALWVFKEPSQANTTVFYHNPTIDAEYGKVYPSTHSSISTGCIGGAVNFSDDIAFFSDRGMEAINGDITTEQVIAHRSSLVDSKLLAEANYEDMILEEWKGYLLVIIDNHVYLADSRAMYTNQDHNEYEWFYWELDKNITCTKEKDGVLYLCTNDGIYTLGSDEEYKEVTFTEENGQYVLNGESIQKTTNGYQLFDSSKLPTTSKGGVTVTNNGDGSFDISGSGTISEPFEIRYYISHDEFTKMFKTGNLYLKNENLTYPFMYVNLYKDGAFKQTILTNRWTTNPSFEITQEHLDEDYSLYIGFNGASDGTKIITGTIKPMLYQDGDGTYEKFTGGSANPNPDYPSQIANTYKAGKYRTTINGKQYRFELTEDLRSAGEYKDKLLFKNDKLYLEKNINEKVLGTPQAFYSGTIFDTLCNYGVYVINDAKKMSRNYEFISNKVAHAEESFNKYAGYLNEGSIIVLTDHEETVENFSPKLSDAIIYYPLGTAETIEIDYTISPLSYWTTPLDEFNYPQYQKTTNKRGSVTDIKGTDITVSTRIDNEEFEDIVTHENITSYVVNRIKKKKWKAIQLKFSSNKPFELYSSTLEAYVGGYVKR